MESLNRYLVAGHGLGEWLLALAWAVGGMLLGMFVGFFSRQVLRRISAKTKTVLDDILLAVIERPVVLFLAFSGLRIGIGLLQPDAATAKLVASAYAAAMSLVVGWSLARGLDASVEAWLLPYVQRTPGTADDQLVPIVRKGGKILIWAVAVLVALKNVGYDVGALLAGLGIGGAAVALAAKDTLSNLFGSVTVFADKPFKLNERIKVAGYDGTVVEMGIRSSRLRTLDNRIVTIPNATFASSPIENVASEPTTRTVVTIDLDKQSGSEAVARATEAILAAARGLPGLAEGTAVGFSGFSDWGLRLTYIYFLRKDADYWATVSAANLAALRAIESLGLRLAQPPAVQK